MTVLAEPRQVPAIAQAVTSVASLTMAYGSVPVLHGIDLQIHRGEVCAIVGPNGAGKTTLVEILKGYRIRTGGTASVLASIPKRSGSAGRSHRSVIESNPRSKLSISTVAHWPLAIGH